MRAPPGQEIQAARAAYQQATEARVEECVAQADLLRCVFSNPFRPSFTPERGWLSRNDGEVVKLATAIYDGRRWDELPLLADALEECGCSDWAALDHLRGPGPHARGCHVLDVLMGRK
jgi:hypothetical protein